MNGCWRYSGTPFKWGNMKLKNLTNKTDDYLDAYCEAELGHTNWGFVHPSHLSFHKNALADNVEIDCCVVFFTKPEGKHE